MFGVPLAGASGRCDRCDCDDVDLREPGTLTSGILVRIDSMESESLMVVCS